MQEVEIHFQPETHRALLGPSATKTEGLSNATLWKWLRVTEHWHQSRRKQNLCDLLVLSWKVSMHVCFTADREHMSHSVWWLWVLLNDCQPPLLLSLIMIAKEIFSSVLHRIFFYYHRGSLMLMCIVEGAAQSHEISKNYDAALSPV